MTRFPALLALLIGSPVAADDIYRDGPAWVRIEAAAGPHVARVTFQNRLTRCVGWCNGDTQVALDAGIGVTVVLDYGGGNIPDTMTVIPPEGYIAIPATVTVGEDAQGVVLIYVEGLS